MGMLNLLASTAGAVWRDRFGTASSVNQFADRQLTRLLNHARTQVPFQQRRLQKAKHWEDLEPTNKKEMMAHFAETISQGTVTEDEVQRVIADPSPGEKWIRDSVLVAQTSGTTGERGVVLIDRHTWEAHRAAIFTRTVRGISPRRRLAGLVTGEKFRMAMLVAEYPFCTTYQSGQTSQRHNSRFSETLLLSIMSPMEETIERLNKFQPHYLYLYPSYLRAIARARLNGSPVRFDPVTLTVGCEVLSDPDRTLIQEAFPQSRLINQYGSTECLAMAIGCPAGPLHLNTDFCHLELVDSQYRPVPAGEFSNRILITNLTNLVQPIIRYELTDSVRLMEQPCICGSPFPVIEIRGRADDVLHFVDAGNRIRDCLPLRFYTALIACPQLDFLQIVHVRQNELELRIQPTPTADSAQVCADAKAHLQAVLAKDNLEQTVRVKVVTVDAVARTRGAGKLKVVMSEVTRDEAESYRLRHAA